MKRVVVLAAACMMGGAVAAAAPATGDALERPAVAVRAPQKAVLVGATLAGPRLVAVGERGIVALSDDDGRHWRQASTPTSVTLTAIAFADARRGWVVGHGGTVLFTDDGGGHWARQLDGRRIGQIAMETARASGDAGAIKEAERLVGDGPDKPLLDLVVFDSNRLLVVGAYGIALYSEDGGRQWTAWTPRLPNPKGLHLYAARRQGDAILLAGEQGLAMLSTDAGRSFRRLETPYRGSFFSAELLGPGELLLAGLRGNVLRSADAGATWVPIASPMPVSITATVKTPGGRVLAVNQAGFLMRLEDDRLLPLNKVATPPLSGLAMTGGDEPLLLTSEGVLRLADVQGTTK